MIKIAKKTSKKSDKTQGTFSDLNTFLAKPEKKEKPRTTESLKQVINTPMTSESRSNASPILISDSKKEQNPNVPIFETSHSISQSKSKEIEKKIESKDLNKAQTHEKSSESNNTQDRNQNVAMTNSLPEMNMSKGELGEILDDNKDLELDLDIESDSEPEGELEQKPVRFAGMKTEDSSEEDIEGEHGVRLKKVSKPVQASYPKDFFPSNPDKIGDSRYSIDVPRRERESAKSWHLRYLLENHQIVENLKEGFLLSVEYDGATNKAFAKFYDLLDNSIKIWLDTTNHEPYCYHKSSKAELENNLELTSHTGFKRIEEVQKFDIIQDREIKVCKIFGNTPTSIGSAGGIKEVLGGAWEANIRYHHNYIYDTKLIPGMKYTIENGIVRPIPPDLDKNLTEKLFEVFKEDPQEIRDMAEQYHPLFSSYVPNLKRVAYDIEVEENIDGSLPDPMVAKLKVIAISFAASDGLTQVYCLDRDDIEPGTWCKDFPKDAKVFFFKDEKTLLEEAFRIFWQYPIIITFNGDNFDNTYLFHRARRLKIDDKMNPITIDRAGGMMISHETDFKHGVHIDLFQFFANRSIKGYAFGGAYVKNSLNEITTSLLGTGKIEHEGVQIGQMTLADLIHYNMNDSIITLQLTQFNQQLVINLLVMLMRITKLPLQDIFRVQISAWVRSLLFYEHRRKNILIPRGSDLEAKNKTGFSQAAIGGKTFQGAYVIDPKPGIHFNVAVMDFSSLYPSIIKTRNLSYETVNCVHKECEENMLPNTPYWACTKHMGIFAYVVGYLRDVRVKWFKPLSSNKTIPDKDRQTAKVIQSALKVFINGAYGVFGSEVFPLFALPVAECTTAIGRFSIQETIKKAESLGITVLYGDSDSVFLLNPPPEKIEEIIKWAEKKLDLDLELDKSYQFLALSGRKKNYIGVKKGGEVDIKGLLAKKHNTPDFIKAKFAETVEILKQIVDLATFNEKRQEIINIVKETNRLIGKPTDKGGFKIDDYAITIVLQRKLEKYVKNIPQHIRAAYMLPESQRKTLAPGSFISFVKARTKDGVKPVELASIEDLDVAKYKELVQSTFEQILDALGIDYQEILGVKKLTNFFK